MNYVKFLLLLVLLHGYPSCSMAQTFNKMVEANYVSNISFETNLIKNPSARAHNGFVSVTNATATRDTSAGNKIDQTASFSVDASAQNGYAEWALNPESDEQTSGNCGFSGVFKGNGTLYKAQILNASSVVLAQTVVLTNETGWREFKVWHPCGASGARKVRITQTEAGTAPAINVGRLFYGRMEPGNGVPPNTFIARVSNTGVVTDETGGDWINGNCTQSSGDFTCNFSSGFFTGTPNCIGSLRDSASSDQTMSRVSSDSTSAYAQTKTGAGTGTSIGFTLTCTKTGSDFIQPAITPAQWDYDWKDYSQAIVPESGTFPTYTLNLMQQARFAGKLYLKGKLTMTGTNTWSEIRIPVPTGLQILTSVIAPSEINYLDAGTNFYAGSTISMNASYIRIGSKSGTNGQGLLVTQAAPFTWASGDTVEWFIGPIDVVGWTTSSAAPQLVGSVIADTSIKAYKSAGVTSVDYGTANGTLTAGINISSVTSSAPCQSMRVGNTVHALCSITFTCTTAAGTLSNVLLAPPIPTTQGSTIRGTFSTIVPTPEQGWVNNSGNSASVVLRCGSTATDTRTVSFMYQVP